MFFSKYLDPKNDPAFKKIFGQKKHKEIPVTFLNAILSLTGDEEIIDLEFLNTIQPPEVEARKESTVDVLVKDQRGVKYIIEMQVVKIAGFEKRAQFYAAKTYCSHFHVGGRYENIEKVVFLAITSYIVFPEKKGYKSIHKILDEKSYEQGLKNFYFTFVELPKFTKKIKEIESLEEKWYYFLKHAEESNSINEKLKSSPEICAAYKIIEKTEWTEAELHVYERAAMAIADAEGALIQARRDGIAEGIAQVRAEGEKEARIAMATSLLNRQFPIEQVAELTGLTLQEIQDSL